MEPKQYNIEALLNSAVQPFDAADDQWISTVAASIRRGGGLPAPIVITEDGVLVDGTQRLTAMLMAGRKVIHADDVRVLTGVDRGQALDYAIQLNAARRHLTVEQKAAMARQLQRERRWSQARIAKAFGVSRPAVSQWLAKVPDPDPEPLPAVEGMDGKTYWRDDPDEPAVRVEPEPVSAWHPGRGRAAKSVRTALRTLSVVSVEPPGRLTALQRASVEQDLQDLIEACEQALERLSSQD